jgi:hypothetical protein
MKAETDFSEPTTSNQLDDVGLQQESDDFDDAYATIAADLYDPRKQGERQGGTAFTEKYDKEVAKGLITDLGSDDFETRDAAQRRLQGMGRAVVPLLREAVKSEDLEVRHRSLKAINTIDQTAWAEENKEASKLHPVLNKVLSHAGIRTEWKTLDDLKIEPKAHAIPKEDQPAIEEMLKNAKNLASRPGYKEATNELYQRVRSGARTSNEDIERMGHRGVAQIARLDGAYFYAKGLAEGDAADHAKARKFLGEHLQSSPDAKTNEQFLNLAARVGGTRDSGFLATFIRAGGKVADLKAAENSLKKGK